MTPEQFVTKWSTIQQSERASAQPHFLDICRLVNHPTPQEYDPAGELFSFETRTVKSDGQKGFADVYFRGHFIWEYKGPHKNLDKAYQQLQLYREALHNPPLLITSDIYTIIIHTNFTNYPTVQHKIDFDRLLKGDGLELLQRAFFNPGSFQPAESRADITAARATTFLAVADAMKKHQKITQEPYPPEQLAHFLARLLFCLFAEDIGLLPKKIFTQMVQAQNEAEVNFRLGLRNLFREMKTGGIFGFHAIRWFNGTLFEDEFVPEIPADLAQTLQKAVEEDWSAVDPSIFGTLFERVIDSDKRAELGAHYTDANDILSLVEPILMSPLRQKWQDIRQQAQNLLTFDNRPEQAQALLANFAQELASIQVLDPACGSGNFLYVALRQLLDLQKEVLAWGIRKELPPLPLTISPEQLLGLEINPYAYELAQITAWIGYLQWRLENGFKQMEEPILKPLHRIRRMNAILAFDEVGRAVEPEWPAADVIIGNPPFLGTQKMRQQLGDEVVEQLRELYTGRVEGKHDMVCYWFEKARHLVETGRVQRVGFIATNSIRQGDSRRVLERITQTGQIFMAWSDRPWKDSSVKDKAAVRVSLIGFDNGTEKHKTLDGVRVSHINPDLSTHLDLTQAQPLAENDQLAFYGTIKGAPFQIPAHLAQEMLNQTNPSGRDNSEVIKPWVNGRDITGRLRHMWIIDFGADMTIEEAQKYQMPFAYVEQHVKPFKDQVRRKAYRDRWWLFSEPCVGMRQAIAGLKRFMITPMIAKHRLFVWLTHPTLPDQRVVVIAREDDYFLGVLQSKVHQLWALRQGSTLEDRPSYAVTAIFQTFPFPWRPGEEPQDNPHFRQISKVAQMLNTWRERYLHPTPPAGDVLAPTFYQALKQHTLTNLYNGLEYYQQTVTHAEPFDLAYFHKITGSSVTQAEIEELHHLHTALDTAVLNAYGWDSALSEAEILTHLGQLNVLRSRL